MGLELRQFYHTLGELVITNHTFVDLPLGSLELVIGELVITNHTLGDIYHKK